MPLTRFDEIIDKQYPPGSPARAAFDARGAELRQRDNRVQALTGWLRFIPPRWEYAEPDVYEGVTYRYHHGLGHIAQCFWSDVLGTLLEGKLPDYSVDAWLGRAFYNGCDGLAFHYLDDAYVPTFTDVRAGIAGRRQASWRRRHAAAIAQAQESLAELRAEGLLDEDEGAKA